MDYIPEEDACCVFSSADAPIMLTTIDTKEQIVRLLFHLDEMVYEGLIAISDVEVIRYVHEESVWS